MTRRSIALTGLAVFAALLAGGCSYEHTSTPTSPSGATPAPATGTSSSYVGTWASAVGLGAVSADKCGNFQWKIASQTETSIAGDISATCGSLTIAATGAATLSNGQNVALNVSGTVSASGYPVCNFALAGTGIIQGDTLPLNYSGTTCLGPVSGTETLKRSSSSTPVVINAPTAVSPGGNVVVSSTQPTLLVTNATRSGPAGSVAYRFQVSSDVAFVSNVKEWLVPEATNQTALAVPEALSTNTTYFWRAQAYDGGVTSPWSSILTFTTPSAQSTPGPAGTDQIDPHSIRWLSPASTDVSDWPITSMVTDVVQYGNTICVYHTKSGQWPLADVFHDGNGANIEGNIMIVAQVNGRWYGAGFDWLGEGRTCKNMPANEYGSDQIRVSPLDASWAGPRPGDRVGFLVSTPSSDRLPARTLNERSNIVVITYK